MAATPHQPSLFSSWDNSFPPTIEGFWSICSPKAQQASYTAAQSSKISSSLDTTPYDDKEGPEMLYARLAVAGDDERSRQMECHNGSRTIYLGDPASLSYVVREGCHEASHRNSRNPARVHYFIPKTLEKRAYHIPYEKRDAPFEQEEYRLLQRKGAFTTLEKVFKAVSCKPTLNVFFACIQYLGQDPYRYLHPYYKWHVSKNTYHFPVLPISLQGLQETNNPVLLPSIKRAKRGRPKVARIRANYGAPKRIYYCSVCHQAGHNRRVCPDQPVEYGRAQRARDQLIVEGKC
jgi:hypothetical protein